MGKKYIKATRRGIRGEAFFESLVSDHCVPIQIVGLKDIGIDYICQWVANDKPTELFFAVQVKTFAQTKRTTPKLVQTDPNNGLKEYRITNPNFKVDSATLSHWQTFGMPVYLFAIRENNGNLTCYYKRFTRFLTIGDLKPPRGFFYREFYKVSKDYKLMAFADDDFRQRGFARDLFVDYIRFKYSQGLVTYLNPRTIGLNQFPEGRKETPFFADIVGPYLKKIQTIYQKTGTVLSHAEEKSNI